MPALALPLRTVSEFNELEERLNDELVKSHLLNRLATFGGTHLRGLTHSIMNGVLAKELAVQFSLQGKNKKKFAGTNFHQCMLVSISCDHNIPVILKTNTYVI